MFWMIYATSTSRLLLGHGHGVLSVDSITPHIFGMEILLSRT